MRNSDWREADGRIVDDDEIQWPVTAEAANVRTDSGREKIGGTAQQGYLHCGPSGAGHFVKMAHNGIEYSLMASYAERMIILVLLPAMRCGFGGHVERS